ncbi:MAG TPA: hypothetical protein VFD07_09840, partial [Candidatus Krumholzibacteria bacterium]|nr:hypothetical protein [Candidatus Krumholzibacteria bacterium]
MAKTNITILLTSVLVLASSTTSAQENPLARLAHLPCCDYGEIQALVWSGTDPRMTLDRLAA